ncbi:MAG: hypothetical protein OEZ13_03705 [Spirochaetia bacterium]|nr:hypothetical protein [Spirochaetia bacterium]
MKVYWFHSASVGEYECLRPIAEKIRKKQKSAFLVFSVFSDSAYKQRQKDTLPDILIPLPFDFTRRMKKVLMLFDPEIIFYARYDVWPNMAKIAKSMGIYQCLISAALPEKSARSKGLARKFYASVYANLDKVFAIHPAHTNRFLNMNVKAETAGDTRYDAASMRLKELPENWKKTSDKIKKLFSKKNKTIIGGSTYENSEKFILESLKTSKNFNLIMAPHHVNKEHIESLKKKMKNMKLSFVLFSELPKLKKIEKVDALLIDTMGVLPYLYAFGDIAYVGGGWKGSVHSVLEPALFSLPVITGPHIKNSQEAIDFAENKFLFIMKNDTAEALTEVIGEIFKKKDDSAKHKKKIQLYFEKNLNASDKILKNLDKRLL